MIKECKHCKEVFRLDAIAKKSVGGKINATVEDREKYMHELKNGVDLSK